MDELLSETVSLAESDMISVEPPEPKSIGSGIVKSVLGKGGASVVYEIWNPKLEIYRAVKLWRIVQSEKTIQRFENETKITAKLHHPNIVDIYTVGEWNGLPYIEMEKIQGTNLKDLIKSQGAIPEEVVTAIAICICRALIYAHNHEYLFSGKMCKGVIHCDIKPANIMISDSGIVKLMDFGIAHPTDNVKPSEKSTVTGSLQYMSPEQLESKLLDARSDLYSLGVLLYELYSGTKAFPAQSLKELIQKRNNNEFSPLGTFCKTLSTRVRAIVEKLMQVDPDKRFQSASELNEELEKCYQKFTENSPESLISSFLAGDNNIKNFKKNSKLSKVITVGVLSLALTISGIYFLLLNKQRILQSLQKNPSQIDSLSAPQNPLKTISTSDGKKIDSAANVSVKRLKSKKNAVPQNRKVRQKQVLKTKPIDPSAKAVESVLAEENKNNSTADQQEINDGTILDEMKRLIKEGHLSQAERMIQEFPLKDGEYYLIHAELLLKRKQMKSAIVEAEKALRIPAGRISPTQLREEVLYIKAKVLSAEFDNLPERQKGQLAMESWYEVKYSHRSNTTHPHYIFADTEIRRISAAIQ